MDSNRDQSDAQPTARRSGLEALARRYAAPLRRYFERRVRDQGDVPDLVQDVLTRIARMGNLASVDKPEHYLFRTASSALRDQVRRDTARQRDRHVEFDARLHEGSDFSPDHVLEAREALASVHATLRALPERTRSVFVLRVFEDLRTADVARALGISTRSVEIHHAKALAAIAAALRDQGDD